MEYSQRTCIICKKKYTPVHAKQKCCSKRCQRENMRRICLLWYHSHKSLAEYKEMICPVCGNSFMPESILQIYCSKKCGRHQSYLNHKNRQVSPFRTDVRRPKHWVSWYHGHDLLDEVDETDLPIHQRRNSILMSLDPYPV